MRKKKELCSPVFFLRCIALQDPEGAKGEMSYMKKKKLYRGFNYFKITHFFQPGITTEAFIKKKKKKGMATFPRENGNKYST